MKRNVKLKKIEKENRFDIAKTTLPGAVAIKDSDDSNVKKKKKFRSQMYKAIAERTPNEEPISVISTNDTSNTQENLNESFTSSCEDNIIIDETNAPTNIQIAYEEETDPVIITTSNEERIYHEQDRNTGNSFIDNYDMPIATEVDDIENTPRAEIIEVEIDLEIVDAEVSLHVCI